MSALGDRWGPCVALRRGEVAGEKLRSETADACFAMADSTRRWSSPVKFELPLRAEGGCLVMRSCLVDAAWRGDAISVWSERWEEQCGVETLRGGGDGSAILFAREFRVSFFFFSSIN